MNKILIDLEKNKNISKDALSITSDAHYFYVTFDGDKTYKYNKSRLLSLIVKATYSPSQAFVYKNKQPIVFDEALFLIDENNMKEHLILTRKTKESLYAKDELTVDIANGANTSYLDYFSEIAQITGKFDKNKSKDKDKDNDKEKDINLLVEQYSRIKSVNPRSALATYLERRASTARDKIETPIFPFSYNISQKSAVNKALSNNISLIQGPPGTGKTQTILNIVANLIMAGKSVAIVSNNNAAIKNVDDKFKANELGFFSAFIGNKWNTENFLNSQTEEPLNLSNWFMEDKNYKHLKEKLERDSRKIDELLAIRTELAQLKSELNALNVEEHYFQEYKNADLVLPLILKSASKYSDFYFDYNRALQKGKLSFFFKLINSVKYGRLLFSFLKNDPSDINIYIQKQYYSLRKSELNSQIQKHTKRITNVDFDGVMKKYTEESLTLFKAYLAKRFDGANAVFNGKDLKSNSAKFIERYPVIFSTTHSLRNCLCDNFIYDYLIVDEASQTDIITGALAMSCAENVVIVGDTRQLPNIVSSKDRPTFEGVFKKYNLPKAYNHSQYSIMSSVIMLLPEVKKNATLLNEHYRCHPKIIGFCNDRYYNGELIAMTNGEDRPDVMAVYKTVERNNLMQREEESRYNSRQIDVTEEILNKCSASVGIIAPYRKQVQEMDVRLSKDDAEIDTVHKFQGREKDIIIFSTVEDEIDNSFIDEPMVNVAVSRAAKQFFIVIPHDEEKITNTNIKDLVNYIRYNNMEIIESKICSIFDLFYRQYSKHITKYEIKYNTLKKDEQIAENLIKILLDELLEMREFSGLSYFRQYPLITLFKSDYLSEAHTLFTDREKQFASNPLSHNDFLVYCNSDKRAILAIEVDGGHHINDPKQVERDAVKDSIFSKIGIPLLRISTKGSMEKRTIYHELCDARGVKPDAEYDDVV